MIRAAALLLTVLTGFSGLVYEVTWQKCLATLLGSHSEATAAVLGIYLGGLSVGYALFGRVVQRVVARAAARGAPPRLLLLYGTVEASIGIWALLFPWLFSGVEALSLLLSIDHPLAGFAVDIVLTILLIGPPTVLMGGTIPILTQALSRNIDDATRFHAFVYGFNTAGAFAGALAAGFVLIPTLGIHMTLLCMGAVNIVAGVGFAALDRSAANAGAAAEAAELPPLPPGFGLFAAAACLLGFAMMSVQTVLIRIGGLALGASHFTFATVVAVFVLCIALGSLAVSAFQQIPRWAVVACPALLALLLGLLYWVLPDTTYAAHVLRTFFSDEPAAFHAYHAAIFLLVLSLLALPVGLSGASLPLLFHELRREIGDLGATAGRLYSWNTIGNLLGALLGGYALLFWLDLHHVYRLGVAAAATATLLLAVRTLGLSRAAAVITAVPLGYALVALPAWPPERMAAGSFRRRTPIAGTYDGADTFFRLSGMGDIIFYDDAPTSTVSVRERMIGGQKDRSIWVNGKSDGSLVLDYPTMALLSIVPCLVADECRTAFVIGFGTGVSVGELAVLKGMERVDVAEISGGVLEAAPLFDFGNQAASRKQNVSLIRSDAYRALMRTDTRYDVIVSEPSNPWTTGIEMLYSREFLTVARDRLAPGGVYAQWLHVYETDTASVELVMRTYTEVFDQVAVWYTLGGDLLLLGFNDEPDLNLARIAARAERPDAKRGLARAGIRSLPALLIHELLPLGVLHEASLGDDVHTLFHPILADRAARAFFAGRKSALPFTGTPAAAERGASASLWQAWLAERGAELSQSALRQAGDQVCRLRSHECATFLAWWRQRGAGPEFEAVHEQWSRHPERTAHLTDKVLGELEALYGEGPRGATTPQQVRRSAELFETYYFHALPFRREVVQSTIARCQGRDCMNARDYATSRLAH
ncbi:MAG: fused MFS/spermidine synthase [Deltaproteobacteria bacterium]|nr:fused MFS/spermidine synthase [Deltaproteobacteria bacterium]